MKKILFLAIVSLSISCTNNNGIAEKMGLTPERLEGAWFTKTLDVKGQIIDTHEHPECLSSFVFKDDKVKLIQMGNHSENGGSYKISNDTIYIYDLILDQCVMKIKVNKISEKDLDIVVLDDQNVRMMLERLED